jgi:Domain of unknown function (DUF5122) beta-propeller
MSFSRSNEASDPHGRGTLKPVTCFLIAGLLAASIVLSGLTAASAAPGSRDRTFNGDGRVKTRVGISSGGRDVVNQPDGKIVVAGYSYGPGEVHFAVVRYTPHGGRDRTFGRHGKGWRRSFVLSVGYLFR